ncbi:unnamed protein product, partial [Rotaria sp. Silwood2]
KLTETVTPGEGDELLRTVELNQRPLQDDLLYFEQITILL